MFSHIQFNGQPDYGQAFRSHLAQREAGRRGLIDDRDVMQTMIDGDGSQIGHFDEVVRRFGFGGWVANNAVTDTQRTVAKAAWDELNSYLGKITVADPSVPVFAVQAAEIQLFNKCR